MREMIAGVLALLMGLVLGGLGPRSELRDARGEIQRLEQQLEDCDGQANPFAAGVASMLNRGRSSGTGDRPPLEPREWAPETRRSGGIQIRFDEDRADAEAKELARALEGVENPEEMLDTAAELWEIRASQARESLIEELGMSPEEVDRFDQAMLHMNQRLMDAVEDLAARVEEDPELGPRDGLELAHEFTGILVDAYGETDGIFDPEGVGEPPEFEVIDFIDPSVARPMLDLIPPDPEVP